MCYALNTFKYKIIIKKGFAEKLLLFLNEGGSWRYLNASLFHTFKLHTFRVSQDGWVTFLLGGIIWVFTLGGQILVDPKQQAFLSSALYCHMGWVKILKVGKVEHWISGAVNSHVWFKSVTRHQSAHHQCSEHSHNCSHTESRSLDVTGREEHSVLRRAPTLSHTISGYQAGSQGDKSLGVCHLNIWGWHREQGLGK